MLIFLGLAQILGKKRYQEYRIQGEFAKKVDDYQESEVRKWAQHEPNYDNEN